MAVILVTYDLKAPGRNYTPVHDYLKKHTYCKQMESVWLLDTNKTPATIRDEMTPLIDDNDVLFVTKLAHSWASRRFGCAEWLKKPERSW